MSKVVNPYCDICGKEIDSHYKKIEVFYYFYTHLPVPNINISESRYNMNLAMCFDCYYKIFDTVEAGNKARDAFIEALKERAHGRSDQV